MSSTIAVPERAIVLGGGWEMPDEDELSVETQMRVFALGELASRGVVRQAILSGGLSSEATGEREANAMAAFLGRMYPEHRLDIALDADCYDTRSSAQNVAAMLDQESPRTLITSRTHLPRATKIFRSEGVYVVPIPAEDILLGSNTTAHREFAYNYLHSRRYLKWVAMEAALRTELLVDPKGAMIKKLAALTRSEQYASGS